MSSGSNADFMLYKWRNVPRSDGYSSAQLMFGHAQRTSLPSLPSLNVPINFSSAASAKDAAQTRSKLDHDRSKLSLASFYLLLYILILLYFCFRAVQELGGGVVFPIRDQHCSCRSCMSRAPSSFLQRKYTILQFCLIHRVKHTIDYLTECETVGIVDASLQIQFKRRT